MCRLFNILSLNICQRNELKNSSKFFIGVCLLNKDLLDYQENSSSIYEGRFVQFYWVDSIMMSL